MTECRLKHVEEKNGSGTYMTQVTPTNKAAIASKERALYQVAHWLTAIPGAPPQLNTKKIMDGNKMALF